MRIPRTHQAAQHEEQRDCRVAVPQQVERCVLEPPADRRWQAVGIRIVGPDHRERGEPSQAVELDHPAPGAAHTHRTELRNRQTPIDLYELDCRLREAAADCIARPLIAAINDEYFVRDLPVLVHQRLETLDDRWQPIDRRDDHGDQW